ncbi:MAG: threonine--tRNA ligase [Candidatus Woykebacteria bacterium]
MKYPLETIRHSSAHVMASAVKNLFPGTKLGIGPRIENGFYYDFDTNHRFSEEDFEKIEKEMLKIKTQKLEFERSEKSVDEAIKFSEKLPEPYKAELIENLKDQGEKKVSFYKTGDFVDLCRGPHVKNSAEIGEFKLLSVAGAYWKGSEKNKMLQRIYGTTWNTKNELNDYLEKLSGAKRRDHKKLGQELSLFTFLPEAPGMPFWYPKGLIIVNELKSYIRELNSKFGYEEISTPLLAKKSVWETSGHWNLFRDNMFTFDLEEQTYALKPMNCPETLLLYNTKQYSYKDLPVKWADLDPLHRYEESGTLHGLFRVRGLSQDDAHVFCEEDKIGEAVSEIIEMAKIVFKTFDLKPTFYLSTRPDKALGTPKTWERAEKSLKEVLEKQKVNFGIKEKDGAFYGPKIDLHVEDSLGRDWQLSTIQLDFQMPERFSATYIDDSGNKKTPVLIHKALFGSLERFLGILIEHIEARFPIWLSPVQTKVLPIAERHADYASQVVEKLREEKIRAETDSGNETLQSRIRNAELQKIPYILVVGDKEQVTKKISVRKRGSKDLTSEDLVDFIRQVKKQIENRE